MALWRPGALAVATVAGLLYCRPGDLMELDAEHVELVRFEGARICLEAGRDNLTNWPRAMFAALISRAACSQL